MSNTKYTDFELLMDVNRLIEKYGVDRLNKSIDYISNEYNSKEIINVIKKISNMGIKKDINKINYDNLDSSEKNIYDYIVNTFNDKKLFSNISKIEVFIKQFNCSLTSAKSKNEKIQNIINLVIVDKVIKFEDIEQKIKRMRSNMFNESNDLEKWAEIIVKESPQKN